MAEQPAADEQARRDEAGMRLALDQAHNALLVGEVPSDGGPPCPRC